MFPGTGRCRLVDITPAVLDSFEGLACRCGERVPQRERDAFGAWAATVPRMLDVLASPRGGYERKLAILLDGLALRKVSVG
jgi:hypothetical protein